MSSRRKILISLWPCRLRTLFDWWKRDPDPTNNISFGWGSPSDRAPTLFSSHIGSLERMPGFWSRLQ